MIYFRVWSVLGKLRLSKLHLHKDFFKKLGSSPVPIMSVKELTVDDDRMAEVMDDDVGFENFPDLFQVK